MKTFWAPQAWIGGRWAERVLLQAGADGCWAVITPDVPAPPPIEEPKLVALEPQVVLQAMPIYLEESDVEAALASA
ncbi:MAG: hypothetical protein J0M00_21670, partial [Burkholderiales bacterium]|nr:hypothetical protein [Burkholderiales bacterium]